MSNSILILGGGSDIGLAIARVYASNGYNIFLTARNIKDIAFHQRELESVYKIKVTLLEFDILKLNSHKFFLESFDKIPENVVCTVGYMGEQIESQKSQDERILVIRTNYEGPVNILSEIANHFEENQSGNIIGISSVAGERGRATNYIYGSSKSGFTTFLSGLRNRLAKKNIHVLTVLPGPVETKMTQGMNLPKFLTSKPDIVAKKIYNAAIQKKNVIYIKSIWRIIMFLIKIIPERIFKFKNF